MSAPQVGTLRVDQLIIDHRVQRPLDQKRAVGYANKWSEDGLGILVVNHRSDGTYHVIDGQHRVAALRFLGRAADSVQCLIYDGLDEIAEAEMFELLNTSKAIQPIDRFRVRVVGRDPVAVQINQVLADLGWTVRGGVRSGVFSAVAAAEKVYRGVDGQGEHLDTFRTALEILTKAWGHDPAGVKGEIVGALGALLLRHDGKIDTGKLIDQLGDYVGGPRRFLADGKAWRDFNGGTLGDALASRLVTLINERRRTNLLPPWK